MEAAQDLEKASSLSPQASPRYEPAKIPAPTTGWLAEAGRGLFHVTLPKNVWWLVVGRLPSI